MSVRKRVLAADPDDGFKVADVRAEAARRRKRAAASSLPIFEDPEAAQSVDRNDLRGPPDEPDREAVAL